MRRRLCQLFLLTALGALVALLWPVDDSLLIRVSTTNRFPAAINQNGRTVLKPEWPFFSYEDSEGFIAAWDGDGGWSWIDRRGRILLKNISDEIPRDLDKNLGFGPRFDATGLALVCRNSKCGWIDRNGNTRIPFRWDAAGAFDEKGFARVKLNSKFGWIDRSGDVVIPLD